MSHRADQGIAVAVSMIDEFYQLTWHATLLL